MPEKRGCSGLFLVCGDIQDLAKVTDILTKFVPA
jgi:hypothetical protein